MTVRLRASIQVVQAATLFGAAGRIDIVEFWVYIAILAAAASATSNAECE